MAAQLVGFSWWGGWSQTDIPSPSDIYSRSVQFSPNTASVTLSGTVVAGDLLLAILVSDTAVLAPPAGDGWTQVTAPGNTAPPGAMGAWWKTAVAGDIGATKTFTAGALPKLVILDLASITGGTVSIDTSTLVTYLGASSSVNQPAITTANPCETVFSVGLQGGANVVAGPPGNFIECFPTGNFEVTAYLVPTAGTAPTQTWTGGNDLWGLLQIAVTSNSALMPLQVGDFFLFNTLTSPSISEPPGWHFVGNYGNGQAGFGGGQFGQVFYKFATASDVLAIDYGLMASGLFNFGAITAFRGISQSGPILSFQGANGTGTTATAPGASGLIVGTPVIWLGNQDDARPAGFPIVQVTAQPATKIYRDWWAPEAPANVNVGGPGPSASVAASYVITAGTSTNSQDFTLNSSYAWGAATIALNPTGATPPASVSESMASLLRVTNHEVRLETILSRFGATPPSPPIPPPFTPTTNVGEPGPRRAILYSLDRQVFEPLQLFPNSVRSAVIETAAAGVKWSDLTNPWSAYSATWESFFSQQQVGVFIGVDDGTQTTWNDLPNPWSTYLQAWDSFPQGGNVDLFSDNSTTDNGLAIPYTMVPALLYENSRQDVLLDSWAFYFKIASFFELVTIEFDRLSYPLANPVPITATFADLSDPATYAVPKAYPGPGQNSYARYIKITFSGNSFYRSFAFAGGVLFVQVMERPSKLAT